MSNTAMKRRSGSELADATIDRLRNERDEARAEVACLRACIKSLVGAAHDYVPEESWGAFVAYAPEAFAGEDEG